ncbi:MAG: FAD-binding oxidoreductase [Alphaproteobacteria bacterium]|jgi:glycine/D-amino acid oxidase-like deaminating enzyme
MADHEQSKTDFTQSPGWYAILPEPGLARRLKGQHTADWVVVGAGVTGLAAARRLGELQPEARIILLEIYRVGYGSSGRNSGFIIDSPSYTPQFDVEYNSRMMRLFRAGRGQLETLVSHHNIDCEWSSQGHVTAVRSPERMTKLSAVAQSLDAVGDDYEWLDSDALEAMLGTPFYHAAIGVPRTVLVNPAALCRGLGETLPANVEVYEDSPVRRIAGGATATVECAEGSISAKGVLLTTGVFANDIGFLKGKLIPLLMYASMSRPLNDAEQVAMSGMPEWGITPGTPTGPTIRRTASNRISLRSLMGHSSNFHISDSLKADLREHHRVSLAKRFPMLSGLDMEHTWGGVICMTRNYASAFGRIEPGVFSSVGYNGVGLARGTISGALLAEHVLGGESELLTDAKALAGPSDLPPKFIVALGVKARMAWYRMRNRGET